MTEASRPRRRGSRKRTGAWKYEYTRNKRERDFPSGENPVICKLCGERLRTLAGHLQARHGINTAEYRRRFPGEPTISGDLRAMRREIWIDRYGRSTQEGIQLDEWTPTKIIAALRADAERKARPPTFNAWQRPAANRPNPATVIRAFGTWRNALREAGLSARGRGRKKGETRKVCLRGHPLTPDNLRFNSRGERQCRKCYRAAQARWYRRKKAEAQ